MLFSELITHIERTGNLYLRPEQELEYSILDEEPIDVIDYFVTLFPRKCEEDYCQPSFLYSYTIRNSLEIFSDNQDKIILTAPFLFEGSLKLDTEIQNILDIGFARSLSNKPKRTMKYNGI